MAGKPGLNSQALAKTAPSQSRLSYGLHLPTRACKQAVFADLVHERSSPARLSIRDRTYASDDLGLGLLTHFVFRENFRPKAAGFHDHLDDFAHRAISAGSCGHIMRGSFYFRPRIGDRDRQPDAAHYNKIG